ncbi:MAG: serine/threonine protein kinase, partial [Planctomycetota bacterium]
MPSVPFRYQVLSEIARGGMGVVLKVEDPAFEREVAMKVALAEGEGSVGHLRRFLNEAKITAQLEHPNIPAIHDLGVDDEGRRFFTMKMVKGDTLGQVLESMQDAGGEIGPEGWTLHRLLEVFLKVCDAIAFAHDKGVIHRDLKPDNVMIGRFGEVYVMDWGLAKVVGTGEVTAFSGMRMSPDRGSDSMLSQEGEVIGTPSYMSPEAAEGHVERVDRQSDVYSLGALLYEILTLEKPVDGSSVGDVIYKVIHGKVVPPQKKTPNRSIPEELQSVCLKAMALDKDDRFENVEAFSSEIRRYLSHLPLTCHTYGRLQRLTRFIRRHPTGSLAAAIFLFFTALGGTATGILVGEARRSKAHAREQEAIADMEALKARHAEVLQAGAEKRADKAEDLLAKGRAVTAVLIAANTALGEVVKALKRSFYSELALEEKRKVGDRHWPAVEKFCASVAMDSPSQAAMLSAKGWLRRLAGYEEEAAMLFAKSK